jgi:hypothetical protein
VSEQGANRVDMYACTKQVGGSGMADGVRAHSLLGWHFRSCVFRVPFDHVIDAETGCAMATTIQENSIR